MTLGACALKGNKRGPRLGTVFISLLFTLKKKKTRSRRHTTRWRRTALVVQQRGMRADRNGCGRWRPRIFLASFMIFFSFWFLVIGRLMLYRRGRPTSIELLLLMVIPKLSLPLSCHSPLGLHHLLRLVGAARGLVALRRVEVLQVGRRMRSARITEVADGVRARSGTAPDATDVYVFPVSP